MAYDHVWMCQYKGQKMILIDDLDHNTKLIFKKVLKKWGDKYGVPAQTKFGQINLQHELLVVTSQYTPRQLFDFDNASADEQVNIIAIE